MRKTRYFVGMVYILCMLILSSILTVSAAGNNLHEIDMQITIAEDGSARIAEKWTITVSEGTEVYKEMMNMGESSIRDFTVTQGGREFETLDRWDVDASREAKAGKAGVIKNGSDYELCFGVGEYGDNEYTMHYTIDKFVAKYQDIYGMNWQLVNQDMNIKPSVIKVDITGHGITDSTRMYAFGFEGNINLDKEEDIPRIIAVNEMDGEKTGRVNYVNILLGMPDSSFTNAITKYEDRTFEEIVEEAQEGSDYIEDNRNGSDWERVIMPNLGFFIPIGLIVCGAAGIVVIALIAGHSADKRGIEYTDGSIEKIHSLDVDYFRDIPCNQNIYFFYYLVVKTGFVMEKEARSGLITALLLDWIRGDYVEFVKEEKKTIFFSNKDTFKIHFKNNLDPSNTLGCELYGYFKEAAGQNAILENKEFEKWCAKHYERLDQWFINVETQMKAELAADGYTKAVQTTQKFLFLFDVPTGKLLYTPKFREEVHHTVGFKKFLLEFGSLGEKETREVFLWEGYLIFASILGIADKVEKEIGRLYPEFSANSNLDTTYTTLATRAFVYRGIGRATSAREAVDIRSSGGGGMSSFGGGGGSFSGGGGGGVR